METFLSVLILVFAAIGIAFTLSRAVIFLVDYSDYKEWKKRPGKK